MKAADVIVGKPGGLTTAEALASGLAFVIVNPIPGQEERNSAHLLENGAAIRCNNMTTIGYKLKKLLEDPLRLAELKLKAHAMSRPNAAMKIAGSCVPRPRSSLDQDWNIGKFAYLLAADIAPSMDISRKNLGLSLNRW